MMKTKLFNYWVLLIVVIISSCKGDSITPNLEVSKTIFTNISPNGDNLTISITSNSSWSVISNKSWCVLDQNLGNNDATLKITLQPNEEQTQRTASVTIKTETITKTISITQAALTLTEDQLKTHHYRIPVIFHVLYKDQTDSKQYMRKGRAAEIITACNALYSNRSGNSTDINLEFVLATEDPSGNMLEESGVERILWDTPTMDCEAFMSNNVKKNINLLWNPDKYVNIMLYTFTEESILGISHLPYTISPDDLGGLSSLLFVPQQSNLSYPHCVSINNAYINEAQSQEGQYYNTLDVVATLTHELGHYFGLHHAFNEKEVNGELSTDVCENTDYCDDTPAYNRYEYETFLDNYTPISGTKLTFADLPYLMKRRDCITHLESTPNNIMDYSISYVNRFTPEQKERIRYVLNHSPFIPGPKVTRTRTRSVDGPQEFPMQMLK